MIAATPPLIWTLRTLSLNVSEPRSHRTTFPLQAPVPLQRPPLTSGAVTPALRAANSIQVPSHVTVLTDAVFVSPERTVESTPTPGAATSTWPFFCEKLATAPEESTAATETTES